MRYPSYRHSTAAAFGGAARKPANKTATAKPPEYRMPPRDMNAEFFPLSPEFARIRPADDYPPVSPPKTPNSAGYARIRRIAENRFSRGRCTGGETARCCGWYCRYAKNMPICERPAAAMNDMPPRRETESRNGVPPHRQKNRRRRMTCRECRAVFFSVYGNAEFCRDSCRKKFARAKIRMRTICANSDG